MSSFDRVVFTFLSTVALLTTVVIWRGDQIGLGVMSRWPQGEATATTAQIKVLFDTTLDPNSMAQVTVEPSVAGEVTLDNRELIFEPAVPLQPNTQYTISIEGELQNEDGRRLIAPITWRFQTGQPRLLFISWGEDNLNKIYQATLPNGTPQPLTNVTNDVTDFSLSPDGTTVLFSVFHPEDDGSDLWRMNVDGSDQKLLLSCEMAACSQTVWVPDSNRIIYERRTISAPGAQPGLPRLWWLDLTTLESVPLFQDSQFLGHGATLSDDGEWLSFISPTEQGIQVYNLLSGEGFFLPNRMGSAASWQTGTQELLLNDMVFPEEQQWEVQLFRVGVESQEMVSLSEESAWPVDDAMAVYSPNGRLIAFARKEAQTPSGRQLWLMNADGSEPRPLTDAPDSHFGPFHWSPDGQSIAMQRIDLKEPFAQPTLVIYDIPTESWQEIAKPVAQPFAWVP